MQRYNPPSTSAQAYCFGCIRQTRKVNQVLQEQYLEKMTHELEKHRMAKRIRELERAVAAERSDNDTMRVMLSTAKDPKEADEKLQEIMDINRKLTEELQKTDENSVTFPFEEWKKGVDTYWLEKYNDLEDYALDCQDKIERLQQHVEGQRRTIDRVRTDAIRFNRMVEEKDRELQNLKMEFLAIEGEDSEEKENEEEVKKTESATMKIEARIKIDPTTSTSV